MLEFIMGIVLGIFLFVMLAMSPIVDSYYKQGQIDALSGHIKYELITNSDSTKTWRKEKTENEH